MSVKEQFIYNNLMYTNITYYPLNSLSFSFCLVVNILLLSYTEFHKIKHDKSPKAVNKWVTMNTRATIYSNCKIDISTCQLVLLLPWKSSVHQLYSFPSQWDGWASPGLSDPGAVNDKLQSDRCPWHHSGASAGDDKGKPRKTKSKKFVFSIRHYKTIW